MTELSTVPADTLDTVAEWLKGGRVYPNDEQLGQITQVVSVMLGLKEKGIF